MMSNNSTKKRITVTHNDNQNSTNHEFHKTTSITNQLKRYKSQDAYIGLFHKYYTLGNKKDNEDLNKLNEIGAVVDKISESPKRQNVVINEVKQLESASSKDKIKKPPIVNYFSTGIDFNKAKVETRTPIPCKIMSEDSIHEMETEENVESIDEEDSRQLDEMKSSELITDFYTNSISEANSICKKQNNLINKLPQPFVKQIKNKFSSNYETKEEIVNKEEDKISKIELNEMRVDKDREKTVKVKNFTPVANQILSNQNVVNSNENSLTQKNSGKSSNPDSNASNISNIINMNLEKVSSNKKLCVENKKEEDQEKKLKIEYDASHRKFLLAAKKGDREAFLENLEILNQINGDINFKDESGWTALHYAADEGNLKIVDILINTYADINSKTNNKKTPLHLAASHGYFDISKLLVENGCIINSLDDEKNTPIHICSSIGHLELLKFLLDRFPQADAKNIYGKSPLELAKKDEIKLLLQEYLKKNESVYHKIPILQADKKAVKSLFKNMNTISNFTNNLENFNSNKNKANNQTNPNSKQISVVPQEMIQQPAMAPMHKPNHTKYQSIDFDKNVSQLKAINQLANPFQNNNINININTNINNPKGPVNVVNLHTPIKDQNNKLININEKIKVNVEAKLKNDSNSKNNQNVFAQASTAITKISSNKRKNTTTSEKRHSSKIPKKSGLTSKTKNSNNSDRSATNNKTSNNISNNEISYLTNNQQNEVLNYTTNPNMTNMNKNNTSSNKTLNIGIKRNNANTSRNLITLANKVEISLVKEDTKIIKKSNKNSKINLSNLTVSKKAINKSNNDICKSKNISPAKKDTNRTWDTNPVGNILNITDISTTKINIHKQAEEESTMNRIEENILNEDNSLSQHDSQNNIHENNIICIENQSSCMMSMDDGNNNLQNVNSYCVEEEKTGAGEFICHALLGKGSFGEVYLVEKKNTNMIYAMKVLSKDRIMGQNLVKYAMTERNVLSITNHPFIVKLNYSFQTSDRLFLILDYCPGGDLALHLERENRFSEERAKIYICEIILALEDLHKRDIIFRDLKPDNVVIDREGHALLTDFGLSKEGVFDSKSAKSFCGSIAYLAPEMLKRTGHGKAVDWYLLGVLFYEMIVGIPPYFTNNKDQLFKNIERAELQIPKFVSEKAENLLKALLQRNPLLRLGSGMKDAEEIKSHEYFSDVNWEDVYNRKLKPPIPQIYNRMLQKFSQPKVFDDYNHHGLYSNYDMISHFDGWSFVNNTSKQPK